VTLRDTFFQDPFFSRRWDEFDQMRRDMIAESRQAWNKIDEEMKRLEQRSISKSLNLSSETQEKHVENDAIEDIKVKEAKNAKEIKQPLESETPEVKEIRADIPIPVQKEKIEQNEVKSYEDREGPLESWFSPIKLVRFPSLWNDGQHDRLSFFREDNVIKVSVWKNS